MMKIVKAVSKNIWIAENILASINKAKSENFFF